VATLKEAALKLPRLKEVRELHGWSQTKLAEESDVSRDSISNYETGQREAYPATAKKLADALDVEIADLIEPARELALPKAEAPRGAGQIEEAEYEDLTKRVVYLDHVDEVPRWVDELTHQADLRGKRLEIIVHEDDSAEIRIKPTESSASTKRAAKKASKRVVPSTKTGKFVVTGAKKRRQRKTGKGQQVN
jgi:transcriptional regulator with XRE-family HTH domain